MRALFNKSREIFVGTHTWWQWKARQGRLYLRQPEGTALGYIERGANAFRCVSPASCNLRRTLEVPLAIGTQARAHLVECALVPERCQHVVHHASREDTAHH